jgi:hypothetical protein
MFRLFPYLFFICLGCTTEIVFTAFTNLYLNEPFCNEPLWSLTGKTYVWMMPIYAIIPLGFSLLYPLVKHLPLFVRLLIYTFGIYVIEFVAGFGLAQITGKCPWEYTTGWHFMGYIRLDYFPAWLFFVYIVETLSVFVEKLKVE